MNISVILPFLILTLGAFLLIKLRFFFILHPINTIRCAFGKGSRREGAITLALSLAGTLGVGNIVGVASAIAIGGAGSVLWLMLSALFSSAIKYSEISLSIKSGGEGIMGVLRAEFGHGGRLLSVLYASLCLTLSLSMGCILQAGAIRGAAEAVSSNGMPYILCAAFFLAASVCAFGKSGIRRAVALTVPFAAATYTGICLCVISANFRDIPYVIRDILASAFTPTGAAGGIFGILTSRAVSEGFAAGLLSNEAGAGTSSLAHSGVGNTDAARAGSLGIIEVIVDTVVICPLTAFAILLGDIDAGGGVLALGELFAKHIPFGAEALLLSVLAFALSTVICWYYYGSVCREYLFGRRGGIVYFIVFIICLAVGLFTRSGYAVRITNFILLGLTVMTALAIKKGADEIKAPSARYSDD
ncbi:MAG: sodium:alanine symporter family protein [Ruminococcaceae bacterium]|nr:sodium:alanine symporter family protein [Oscillospiraceae bacterium]